MYTRQHFLFGNSQNGMSKFIVFRATCMTKPTQRPAIKSWFLGHSPADMKGPPSLGCSLENSFHGMGGISCTGGDRFCIEGCNRMADHIGTAVRQ